MDRGPIFVAGLERSGTSLLYALLASHPDIAMTRRTNLWTHFYGQYGDLAEPENLERCLNMMMRYRRLAILQLDFERLRDEFWRGEATYPRLFALIEEQHAERLGKPRWGDKSLNTERYAGPILLAYPGARILHMIRDPRDRFASSLARWGVRRGGVGAGTAEWLASAKLARLNAKRFPDRYRVVTYEELATAPERTMRDLCDFVDEPFHPGMLAMEGAPRLLEQGGNSSYGRREPGTISGSSIGRYRQILSAGQIRFIQLIAGREMSQFAYEPDRATSHERQRVRFVVREVPLELVRLFAWRLRESARDLRGRPVPSYRLIEPKGAS